MRSGAHRRYAPQLAVPARSPRRRLRSDSQRVRRFGPPAAGPLRMPAEWEPHRSTWISWPHHEPDWPGKLGAIPWVYAEIVRVLAAYEQVDILCQDDDVRARARAALDAHNVSAHQSRLHVVASD